MFLWIYLKCDLIITLDLSIVLGGRMLWAPFGWQNIMFFHGLLPSCGFPGLWTLWGLLYSRLTCSQLCKAVADQKALSVSQIFMLLNWQLCSMAMILFNYNRGHPWSLHALHCCWNSTAFTEDKKPKINNNNNKKKPRTDLKALPYVTVIQQVKIRSFLIARAGLLTLSLFFWSLQLKFCTSRLRPTSFIAEGQWHKTKTQWETKKAFTTLSKWQYSLWCIVFCL